MSNYLLKMKLILFFACALFINATASVYSQNTQFTFSVEAKSIKDVFRIIEKESEFRFLYNDDFTDLNRSVTIDVKNNRIESILDQVLNKSEITYRILDNNLIVITPVTMVIQGISITGTVTDNFDDPLPGVNVVVKGTSIGQVTDANGRYTITVPNQDAVLQFSFVGYTTKEYVVGSQTFLNIQLSEDANQLEEVVVVGYAVQKKVNLSGAVQAVSGKTIENRPISNVNRGLQGVVSNLNIANTSGRADAAPSINVRGFTSINGGGAFILVDNVPVTSEELSRLNPADIASVSVLKDAASAAIYGARAAFGVVLVTTKKATSDKLVVNVNSNVAIRDRGIRPEIVTDVLLAMEMKQAARLPLSPIYSEAQFAYARQIKADPTLPRVFQSPGSNFWEYYGETDWIDEAYRNAAPSYNTNISISKRTDNLSFYVSGGLYQEDGLLNYGNDHMKRYNFRGNVDLKLTNWWKLGTNVSYVASNYDSPTFLDGYFYWTINRTAALNVPRNPDGTWTQAGAEMLGALESGGRREDRRNETQISFTTQIDLVKDVWTVNADANFRQFNFNRDMQNLSVPYRRGPNEPIQFAFGERGVTAGNTAYAQFRAEEKKYDVYNLYTNFTKTFAEKHFFNVMLGYNREYTNIKVYTTRKTGLISQAMPEINLATGDVVATNSINELALDGFFGRLNYIYDNRYIVEANGRYDGSSRFPRGSRYGFFPSFSAAWVLSKESFFEGVAETLSISNLKFRGSYGALGNQVNNLYYPYLPTMGNGQIGQILDGTRPQAVWQPGVVSSSLTWEKVRTINGGIDIGLLDNKFDLSFDIYTRFTEGMLTRSKELPAVFGATEPSTNAADLKTKGWELTVGYRDAFNLANDPFRWSVRFMLADYRTWITKFDNPTKLLSNYYEGRRIGEMWGFVSDGFFQNEAELAAIDQTPVGEDDNNYRFYVGDIRFKDLNNDGVIDFGDRTVDNPGDRKIIGNSEIRFPYSFELMADWKGFDLRAFFQGVGKRDWYPSNASIYFWGIYAQPWTNPTKKNLDHWTPENRDAYFPRIKAYIAEDNDSELGATQTKYLQSTAYLRLKNITLGYTLPKTMLSKLHIEQLRVYFSAENVFTISGLVKDIDLDPEISNSSYSGFGSGVYPMQRIYSFGVNLTF